jgi:hypothetical protein
VSGVVVVRLGAVVAAGLRAGSVGTVGDRARAGARLGGAGWGSRVAEATRAARTPVVSPKATSSSRQGHRELVRCRGGDGRCRGGGVDMGMSRFDGNVKADMAHFLGALPGRIPLRRWPCSPVAASSTGRMRSTQSTRRTLVSLPGWRRAGRSMVVVSGSRRPLGSTVTWVLLVRLERPGAPALHDIYACCSADRALLVGDNRDHRRSGDCRLRPAAGGTPCEAP